jgi:hypothetical protein
MLLGPPRGLDAATLPFRDDLPAEGWCALVVSGDPFGRPLCRTFRDESRVVEFASWSGWKDSAIRVIVVKREHSRTVSVRHYGATG